MRGLKDLYAIRTTAKSGQILEFFLIVSYKISWKGPIRSIWRLLQTNSSLVLGKNRKYWAIFLVLMK